MVFQFTGFKEILVAKSTLVNFGLDMNGIHVKFQFARFDIGNVTNVTFVSVKQVDVMLQIFGLGKGHVAILALVGFGIGITVDGLHVSL